MMDRGRMQRELAALKKRIETEQKKWEALHARLVEMGDIEVVVGGESLEALEALMEGGRR